MSTSLKIKIFHILQSLNIGGLQNGVVNLINESDKNIFEHEICCITKSENAKARLNNDINIYEINKHEENSWRMIFNLAKLIKASQPDIVHTRNWGTIDGIVAAKLSRVSIVIHGEHGWNMDDHNGQNIKRRLARKILSLWVNCFIAVSENIKQWLINSVGINQKKIIKILNGVDTDKFCPYNKADIRASLGLKDEIVIGTIGRLDPIKRQDLLLKAFSRLDDNLYNLKLVLVGDGPERFRLQSLRQKAPHPEHIILLGERNNVHELYNIMDIFVLPSRNEGISNTILEAMATGLPVIATSVGGNPELVTHAKTGFLIPKDSYRAIQDAINYYLKHPEEREHHGLNARLEAKKRFSLNSMTSKYEDLYKSLYSSCKKWKTDGEKTN